jgi:hypothetical protein
VLPLICFDLRSHATDNEVVGSKKGRPFRKILKGEKSIFEHGIPVI